MICDYIDDNHLLAEWLAYHYHTLPLRRLIVGIDPRSVTSPSAILDRYRKTGMMKITEWTEVDIMPPHFLSWHKRANESDFEKLKELYIARQFQFYTKCMAVLKLEGISWTAITDTDEYILPNRKANDMFRLKVIENKTMYEILSHPENQRITPMISKGCVSMHRLQFGHKESSELAVQQFVPSGFNGSHFSTLRWRYHDIPNKKQGKIPGKCMINLDLTNDGDFLSEEVNSHRPVKRLCSLLYTYMQNMESPFVTYHYTGSWEQWNYRNDFRPKRQRENFDKLYFDDEKYQDDTIRPWLQDFVAQHGYELASYLLRGAGQLEPKPHKM